MSYTRVGRRMVTRDSRGWKAGGIGLANASGYNGQMQIILNGQPRDCPPAITVIQLLEQAGYAGRRVAVELNQEIVPRSQHASRLLADGDQLEIVHAIGGG
ncbi:sulfur carrier protein ThiS [Rhodanobacter sp. Col0626]|uniref:sulfur carrier protein ThiS n=1 Tax=Rhodanobacter sp. Col0626 TaxID=3415679 RepID=UPI003CF7D7FE